MSEYLQMTLKINLSKATTKAKQQLTIRMINLIKKLALEATDFNFMTKIWAWWMKYFDDFLNLFTKINSKWDKNAMKKGFLPKIIKTYLHQLRQYSNVFCKNRWESKLQLAKMLNLSVTL